MKLLILTYLKEHATDVEKICKQANIYVYSTSDVTGFKNGHESDMLEEWFASGTEKFDSMILFSFTDNEKADEGMTLIKKFNEENQTPFPIKAFIVPVEKFGS